MSRSIFRKPTILLPLAGVILASLGGCTPPGDLARKRYLEATQVESVGDLDGAEGLYRQLLTDYPGTEGAAGAERQLERIRQRRVQLQKEAFMPVLHRLRKIVESYQGVTGRVPRELADFDREDSFFNSDYLASLVPDGFVAYLQLQQGKENFLVYALRDGSETGYRVDRYSAVLHPVRRDDFLARLKDDLAATDRRGNLILIRRN